MFFVKDANSLKTNKLSCSCSIKAEGFVEILSVVLSLQNGDYPKICVLCFVLVDRFFLTFYCLDLVLEC